MIGWLLALLLLLATPSWAAIAHVQTVSCTTGGGTSCTTASTTTTSGNLTVASMGWGWASGWVVALTDSKSNTWTNAVAEFNDGNYSWGRADYNASLTGGASHTFTITGSVGGGGGFYGYFGVTEVSGAAASPLDKTATGTGGASGTTSHATAATATTAQANELLLGYGAAYDTIAYTTNTGAGWTERVNNTPNANGGMILGTKVVSATGTYTYTFTSPSPAYDVCAIMTFKEAAAAAGVRQRCVGCGADGKVIE